MFFLLFGFIIFRDRRKLTLFAGIFGRRTVLSRVIVIGAGPAGCMSAVFAALSGASVTLLEKNEKPGKKLYITGKGRCNVTNDCDRDAFLSQVARNPRFLYSALSFFGPQDLMRMLEDAGCRLTVQRGKRVFPASEKASDITRTLVRLLEKHRVQIMLNTAVASVLCDRGQVTGVRLSDGRELRADAVIIATGGKSYPGTGSTGDGYLFARQLGYAIEPLSPALSAMVAEDEWPCELQGLSLKNIELTLSSGNKTLYTETGEMLFTHFGISGPLVLEASCHWAHGCTLTLNLKPGLTGTQLDARLLREFSAAGRRQLRNILPALLPARLALLFPGLCGLVPDILCSQITAEQRSQLAGMLQALPVRIRGLRPIEEAIVTRGGIRTADVDPHTMRGKRTTGLYFAGEILDVDAHTGGFNLQIAFSTGALAGESAARESDAHSHPNAAP